LTEDTAEDEPWTLGYYAARRHALERAGDTVPNTYEVGQSSRSTPGHTHTSLRIRTRREDPMDESPPVSPVIPLPVATTAPAAELDEGALLEIEAQLELHGSILHTHTERLDALSPTLFESYGRDFTELFARSEAVCEEIYL
ncbi:hypothetical protein Tco_0815554, partial [Tanacetum coccineum]